jgi:hypothetical protein
MFDQRVQMNQQFMHRRDQRHLRQFTRRTPAAIGGSDRRIVCDGRHGRHMQGGPDAAASALDPAIAAAPATVVGQGSEADEFADLPMTERPQLRQRREQAGGGGGANAGHRLEEVIAGAPDWARLDLGAQLAIGLAQLLLEPGDMRHDILADGAAGQREPVPLGGQHVHELPPSGDQRLQIGLEVIGQRSRRRLDPRAKGGEDRRIDRIGLFQEAERLGKIADLSGIDNRDGEIGRRQGTRRADFIAAGRSRTMMVGCNARTCSTSAVQPASSFAVCHRAVGLVDQATSKVALETSMPTRQGFAIALLLLDHSTVHAQPCECEVAIDLLYEL